MDAFELRRTLDRSLRPDPAGRVVDAEAAWKVLRALLPDPPTEAVYQELCFSVDVEEGAAEQPARLLVYFGWLIDAKKQSPWGTFELSLYCRYPLTPVLADELEDLRRHSFDTALEADPADPDLVGSFLRRVDSAGPVWAALRDLPMETADYSCVVSSW